MPWIVCTSGPDHGLQVEVREQVVTVGRSPDNHVRLVEEKASRFHCHVVVKDNRLHLQDLNSTNGTLVLGEKVRGKTVVLEIGARFAVGQDVFEFRRGADHRLSKEDGSPAAKSVPWEQGKEQTQFETHSDLVLTRKRDILSFLMPWRKS